MIGGLAMGRIGSILEGNMSRDQAGTIKRLNGTVWLPWLAAACLGMALVGLCAGADKVPKGNKGAAAGAAPRRAELRGRIVCLPEALHELYHTDLPTDHQHVYSLKTADGTFYVLLRTKLSEALFVDEQVRAKELILTGRVFPGTQVFEMTEMKSVRNGVVCDLYYYCDICAIKTLAPGPCMCCQGPVKLVEKPVR
jgi:hypothetical protein